MKTALNKIDMLTAICNVMFDGNKSKMGKAVGVTPQTIAGSFKRGSLDERAYYQNSRKVTEEGVLRLNPFWLLGDDAEMTYIEGATQKPKELTDAEICRQCDERGLHKTADGQWVKTQSVMISQDVPI